MAFQVADRVKETTTTTGTGTLDLGGAASGFETFVAGIGNGNETYYVITDPNTGDFEVGVGTVTDAATDTLSRDSVITSSNAGSLVNFGAGTKDVFCSLPSERAVIIDDASNVEVTANITATSFDGSGAALTSLNASNVSSGTLPDARFPATLPAASGENLTGLNASNLASGTLPDARFPATLPALNGSALTDLEATNIATGLVPTARLGTGTASSTTFLAGDQTYKTITADITGVTAGSGLTGGGTSGDVTLNVGAGTGVTVNADDIAIGQDVATSASPTFAGLTTTGDINFGDNDKANFGAGNDLQIYHDGINSYIDEVGTGSIFIRADDYVLIDKSDGSKRSASFNTDDAVILNFNNVKKFETTSAGVTVTGTLTETSSIEYKENVQPLEFNEAIYNVNAVRYDRKDGSQKDEVGVIAEELYKVLPDLVTTKDGKPEAVKYTKMTMYLLEALKKQNQEIQLLKEKLNG
jgi:hypothetical protein